MVKHLWGNGATFHADVWRDGQYTCKGMVYARIFYVRTVLFSGGMPSPSTPVLIISDKVHLLLCSDSERRRLLTLHTGKLFKLGATLAMILALLTGVIRIRLLIVMIINPRA